MVKLAIVRDLERLYAPLMDEAMPPPLKRFSDRLAHLLDAGHEPGAMIEETTEG